jgi:hypothetical protein
VIPVLVGSEEMWGWGVSCGLGAARWSHTGGHCDGDDVAGDILVVLL